MASWYFRKADNSLEISRNTIPFRLVSKNLYSAIASKRVKAVLVHTNKLVILEKTLQAVCFKNALAGCPRVNVSN